MYHDKRIIAIIPARGGSKGIPKKNLRLVGNKPLINYIINTAKQTNLIDEVVVTSDDETIISIARMNKVNVVNRPHKLSDDVTTLDPVIFHALKEIETKTEQIFDIVITLQPTSPLLKKETLIKAIKQFEKEDADTLVSVKKITHLFWVHNGNKIEPFYKKRENRQKLKPTYFETGAILISKKENTTVSNRFGGNISFFSMPSDEEIDIDNWKDLVISNAILDRKKIIINIIGENKTGLGHVYRMLTYAQHNPNHEIKFIIHCGQDLAVKVIANSFFDYIIYDNNLEQILQNEKPDIIINDILDTTKKYMAVIRKYTKTIVNFEDIGEGSDNADVIINALYDLNIEKKNHFYGYKFECLKPEFYAYPYKKLINPKTKKVLITFGGTDPSNQTKRILKIIGELGIIEPEYLIIVGLGYSKNKLKEIKQIASNLKNFKIEILQNITNMEYLMYNSDVAITSNGRTVYELTSMGVPFISIAQNDREITHLFSRICRAIKYLGKFSSISDSRIKTEIKDLLNNYDTRKKMNAQLKPYADDIRKGYKRINEIIMKVHEEDD